MSAVSQKNFKAFSKRFHILQEYFKGGEFHFRTSGHLTLLQLLNMYAPTYLGKRPTIGNFGEN